MLLFAELEVRQMKENNTDNKLGTELLQSEIAPTITKKFKLKFTDYAVEKFTANFIYTDKNGNTKTKDRSYVPFDVSRHTILKGLKLVQYQKSKKKYFIMQIWFNSKPKLVTIGEFQPGVFTCRECENKVFEIARAHQDNKGIWIKDPLTTIHNEKTKIVKADIEESHKLTINEVIIRLCKANFPKAKREGRLTADSIQKKVKDLIGWNWRTRHLIYLDDRSGHGQVHFKANFHKRTAKPEDWDDLFKKFPSGHGINKDKKFNPSNERSVFDSDLGKLVIDELNTGIVKRYLEHKDRSFGKKKNMLDTFKTLWAFAKDNNLFGDIIPQDPTKEISFKRPDVSQSPGSIYNERRFTEEELGKMWTWLTNPINYERYPFQAEIILLMMITGRRAEETMKIRRSMINLEKELITLPASITKARKIEYVDITPPVAKVLEQINKHINGKHKAYKFLDWLFPTTRINQQKLHEDYYVRSDQCRTKEIRGVWKAMMKDLGMTGAPKMLRKSFSSIAKIELGTTSKARALTGHEQDATLDIHYDKTDNVKRKEYANLVAKKFDFDKASNE